MNVQFHNHCPIDKETQFEKATQGIMRAALLWSIRQIHADGIEHFRRDLSAGLPPHLAFLMSSIADDLDAYLQARSKGLRLNQDMWEAVMSEVGGRDAAPLAAGLLWEFVPQAQSGWKRK